MSIRRLLDKTVTVRRLRADLPDGQGGYRFTEAEQWTAPARISPVSAREQVQYQQQQFPVTHRLYFLGSAGVRPGDEVGYGGRTFHVAGVVNPSEAGHHLEVLAEERA